MAYHSIRHCIGESCIPYTGRELRPHWLLQTFQLTGDAIAAFVGPCDVPLEHMVDLADVAAGEFIRARLMLHFIAEFFDTDLEKTVLRQRLLVAVAAQCLSNVPGLTRSGDDLFVGERKLSVSIATASPVSSLIHLALNIDPTGAPCPAIGLDELGVDPHALARDILEAFVAEMDGVWVARTKVRPVS